MLLYWDNGKENGNYYSILGLYRVLLELSHPAPLMQVVLVKEPC